MPATVQREKISCTELPVEDQIATFEAELRSLRQAAGGRVILPGLHDPATGRVDTQKVAEYLGVPLKRLAEGLEFNY